MRTMDAWLMASHRSCSAFRSSAEDPPGPAAPPRLAAADAPKLWARGDMVRREALRARGEAAPADRRGGWGKKVLMRFSTRSRLMALAASIPSGASYPMKTPSLRSTPWWTKPPATPESWEKASSRSLREERVPRVLLPPPPPPPPPPKEPTLVSDSSLSCLLDLRELLLWRRGDATPRGLPRRSWVLGLMGTARFRWGSERVVPKAGLAVGAVLLRVVRGV
mmetsp:Transcript_30890/g.89719  ORF Transcript_30890/g.89719 Transcript_30890/m.89719 type:complete len:222 (-) Transcript_30890:1470-2135(-)